MNMTLQVYSEGSPHMRLLLGGDCGLGQKWGGAARESWDSPNLES